MLGRAAVAMWWDVPPEVRAEWEDWHSHEHMPERLGIPGFLRGTRWIASITAALPRMTPPPLRINATQAASAKGRLPR